MNKRMTIGIVAFTAMLGGSSLMFLKEKHTVTPVPDVALAASQSTEAAQASLQQPPAVLAPAAAALAPIQPIEISIQLAPALAGPAATPAVPSALAPAPLAVQPVAKSTILESGELNPASSRALTYTARSGDTLSELAVALLGKDSKANRDIIVNANPSLQDNPDRVVIGRVYDKSAPAVTEPAAPAVAESPAPVASKPVAIAPTTPEAAKPELKYTAKPGDTVTNLAGALLGAETKTNRDAIVNANASLQHNADRVVAGRTYRIPAPDGLSAATQPIASSTAHPTTRPDSDEILKSGAPRNLRYTAKTGDTVTSLAVALLGSDTKSNRDTIINTNPTLKSNPDRVIVGQTYWIPAPVAEVHLTQ
jgi:hypothetical protein